MINRDLVAVFGLIAAVAIMGAAFTHTLWHLTIHIQKNESLKIQLEELEKENMALKQTMEKIQNTAKPSRSDDSSSNKVEKTSTNIFTTIAKGQFSNILEERQVILRSGEELQNIWKELYEIGPLPSIDFAQNTVVGIFYGSKPNMCYDVSVENVMPFKGRADALSAIVFWSKTTPTDETACVDKDTQAFHLVMIPAVIKESYFQVIDN